MPCPPSLTQACPPLEASQQQQQRHQQPRLSPTEPHGQAKCLTVCLSKGLSAASQSLCCPPGPGELASGTSRGSSQVPPLPKQLVGQVWGRIRWPRGFGIPGRGPKRTISCCATWTSPWTLPPPTPGGPGQGGAEEGGGSSRVPGSPSDSLANSPNLALGAPHHRPVLKGVTLTF